MVDPSTYKDSEVHEGCREIWSTQGVQEADAEKGNDVFKIIQVGSAHAFHLLVSANKLLGILSLAKASAVFWVGKNLFQIRKRRTTKKFTCAGDSVMTALKAPGSTSIDVTT